MTLGLLLDASSKFQDAVQPYERILVLNPSFAPAQRQLAIIYSEALPNEAKAIDLATTKRFFITERIEGKLEAQMLNAFNHPTFAQGTTGLTSTGFGRANQTATSRRIEFRGNIEF
jgi:hypothetical protein